jgi:hypothetical protein
MDLSLGMCIHIYTCIYSGELIKIQHWITFTIALGMIETTLMFSHYMQWNEEGDMSLSLLFSGLLFGVTKRASSRVVILVSAHDL